MKEKLTPHIIAVTAFVVFIVLGLACASSQYRDYPIPDNLKKTYSETIVVPNMPAEELYLKIHLFLTENINNYVLESLKSEKGKTVWKLRNVFQSYNNDRLEVSQENGQCRVNFVPISILAENSKDFQEEFTDMESNWKNLTKNIKETLLSEPLAYDEISKLIQIAYNKYNDYKNGEPGERLANYNETRGNFYKAAINDPYNEDILIMYANCMTERAKELSPTSTSEPGYFSYLNIGRSWYNKALAVSGLIPSNPNAVNITKLCREGLRQLQQLESQRQQEAQLAEAQRQQQEDENFNNLIASMNALASSIQQQQQGQSGSVSSGNTGSQGQARTSGGSSSSSSKNISAARVASMQSDYNTRAKAIEQTKRNWENASTTSEKKRLEESFNSQKRSLRAFREDCNRQGADIRADYWETASLY